LVTGAAVGLVMIAFVAGYFLGKSHGWEASERSHQAGLVGTVAPVAPNHAASDANRSEIDFYDTLPQTTVPSTTPSTTRQEAGEEQSAQPVIAAPGNDPVAGLIEQKSSYTVQVGSFHEQDEALALKEKLTPLGEPVTIQRREQGDGSVWYRVQLGEYPNRGQAQKMADHIEMLYQSRPLVVLR